MILQNFFPLFYPTLCKNNRKLYKLENNIEWCNTFVNLVNLSLDLFKWNNLPDTCNERFLEQALLFEGRCGFANDPELGYLTLRCNSTNTYNIYGDYSELELYSANGYNRRFKNYLIGGDNSDAEAVLCRDNDCCYPYYLYIMMGAERLSSAMRGIDVASAQLKRPYYITCAESQKVSVEKVLNDVNENKMAVITTKGLDPEAFQVLQTGANPDTLLAMWDNYYKHDNNIRTLLGIESNQQTDKKERLLVDEVNSNNQVTAMNINMRLKTRELFCEQVNELFGLNVSVELKYDIEDRSDDFETTDNLSGMEGKVQPVGKQS